MPRVLATFDATAEERSLVDGVLGHEVVWADGLAAMEGPVRSQALGQVEAVLTFWPQGEMRGHALAWDDLPKLRLVQLATAGANHAGWSRLPTDVDVAVASGGTAHAIAEYVLGAIIAWCRGFQASTRDIRTGRFQVGRSVQALAGLRVGLVGHGGIGQALAAMLDAHGCRVLACSRRRPDDPRLEWSGTLGQVRHLAARSDVLVACIPLVGATEGLVDADVLAALPDQALVVNVARGPVIDQEALYAWLAASAQATPDAVPGRWAHLDVWWTYPRHGHPFDLPFDELPNVTMTPHNSPNTPGFRLSMLETACMALARWLRTGADPGIQERAAYEAVKAGPGRGG